MESTGENDGIPEYLKKLHKAANPIKGTVMEDALNIHKKLRHISSPVTNKAIESMMQVQRIMEPKIKAMNSIMEKGSSFAVPRIIQEFAAMEAKRLPLVNAFLEAGRLTMELRESAIGLQRDQQAAFRMAAGADISNLIWEKYSNSSVSSI